MTKEGLLVWLCYGVCSFNPRSTRNTLHRCAGCCLLCVCVSLWVRQYRVSLASRSSPDPIIIHLWGRWSCEHKTVDGVVDSQRWVRWLFRTVLCCTQLSRIQAKPSSGDTSRRPSRIMTFQIPARRAALRLSNVNQGRHKPLRKLGVDIAALWLPRPASSFCFASSASRRCMRSWQESTEQSGAHARDPRPPTYKGISALGS